MANNCSKLKKKNKNTYIITYVINSYNFSCNKQTFEFWEELN